MAESLSSGGRDVVVIGGNPVGLTELANGLFRGATLAFVTVRPIHLPAFASIKKMLTTVGPTKWGQANPSAFSAKKLESLPLEDASAELPDGGSC